MSHWYAKARDTLNARRPASREPVPFARTCLCGETITGERLPQAREVACPRCGRDWFILPRDPYPASRPRRRAQSPPKRPSWLRRRSKGSTSPATSNTAGATKSAPVERSVAPPSVPATGRDQNTRDVPGEPHTPGDQPWQWGNVGKAIRGAIRREARPIRLVLAGGLAAVALTGIWMWHRARVDEASATIVRVVPLADEALAERDFATAEKLLSEAVAAVDLLGADDETAARIRQRHRELVALTNLSGKTPFDLAVDAGLHDTNPATWESGFQASYHGRWVVFDVPMSEFRPATPPRPAEGESPESSGEPPHSVMPISLSLLAGATPVQFEIDAGLFQPLDSPKRVVFAAQYESWQHQPAKTGRAEWVVRFRPETAFLWVSPDTLATLGFELDDPDNPLRAVLKEQAAALGVPVDAEAVKVQDEQPE